MQEVILLCILFIPEQALLHAVRAVSGGVAPGSSEGGERVGGGVVREGQGDGAVGGGGEEGVLMGEGAGEGGGGGEGGGRRERAERTWFDFGDG